MKIYMSKKISQQPGQSIDPKPDNQGQFESYGQDEHGTLAGEERDEVIINAVEGGAEVKDPEHDEREFRDQIESEGSQDPYS